MQRCTRPEQVDILYRRVRLQHVSDRVVPQCFAIRASEIALCRVELFGNAFMFCIRCCCNNNAWFGLFKERWRIIHVQLVRARQHKMVEAAGYYLINERWMAGCREQPL